MLQDCNIKPLHYQEFTSMFHKQRYIIILHQAKMEIRERKGDSLRLNKNKVKKI